MSEDDLLDFDGSEYVCSDGGDSLLDSDCEEEREKSSTQPSQSVIRSHSPHNVPQNTPIPPRSERSRIVRLDGPRKFRCVDEALPDDIQHVSKRAKPQKRLTITRPHNRITKPSLLLDTKRLLVSNPQFDLRNTLIADRTNDLRDKMKTTGGRLATPTPPTPDTTEVIHSRPHPLPHPLSPSSNNHHNPFYARIQSISTTSEDVNPFFTALKEVNEQQTFSFSLSHITK